jgi:hypothetical protein
MATVQILLRAGSFETFFEDDILLFFLRPLRYALASWQTYAFCLKTIIHFFYRLSYQCRFLFQDIFVNWKRIKAFAGGQPAVL